MAFIGAGHVDAMDNPRRGHLLRSSGALSLSGPNAIGAGDEDAVFLFVARPVGAHRPRGANELLMSYS